MPSASAGSAMRVRGVEDRHLDLEGRERRRGEIWGRAVVEGRGSCLLLRRARRAREVAIVTDGSEDREN